MSHDEASDLLGAYALDAVDGDEFTELEEHLETCPRCRAELDSLREVAAAMGNSVEPVPEGLWSQIALRLPDRQEDEEPPPMPRLAPEARSPFRAPAAGSRAPAPRHGQHHRRHRRGRRLRGGRARHRSGAGRQQGLEPPGRVTRGDGRLAGTRAPARRPRLEHLKTEQAKVVVLPSGQGYLVSSALPSLDKGRTYQLWAIEGNQPDLPRPAWAVRRARPPSPWPGSTRPSHLSITAEPAGGSVFPTGPIIATGTV